MPPENLPGSRQASGSNALKNISTFSGCQTPGRPYLKAEEIASKTVYFIRPDCKQWSCPPCAARRAAIWRHLATFGGDVLLSSGLELSFVTLTSHRLVRSVTAGVAVWRKAWPKLSARWRRASPGLQYISIGERGEVGNFHAHLITSAPLETRWYKDNGAETGLGYQAKAVPILEAKECGGYVTKYLTKAIAIIGWPPYYRRVNTSQKWPKPEAPLTLYEWTVLGSDLLVVEYSIRAYARQGWTISHNLELSNSCGH